MSYNSLTFLDSIQWDKRKKRQIELQFLPPEIGSAYIKKRNKSLTCCRCIAPPSPSSLRAQIQHCTTLSFERTKAESRAHKISPHYRPSLCLSFACSLLCPLAYRLLKRSSCCKAIITHGPSDKKHRLCSRVHISSVLSKRLQDSY